VSVDASLPQISVVIPCHNAASTVARAVASTADGGVDVEVVVVDDGSIDGTSDVVRSLADPRVRLVVQPNGGVCAARNAGARRATSPFLVFLDADDELQPGALGRYVDLLDPATKPLVRAAQIVQRGVRRDLVMPVAADPRRPHPRGPKIPGSFAVSKGLFERVGGYAERLRYGENTELLLRLAEALALEGRSPALIEQPAVLVHREDEGRADRYGSAPAEAARYILEHHSEALRDDPQIRHDYRAIIGVDRLRHRDRRGARREFVAAWRDRPLEWRSLVRILRTFGPIGRGAVPLVMVVSPGAGRIRRGYEAFARDFFEQLDGRADLRVMLLQGGRSNRRGVLRIRHLDRYLANTRRVARWARLYPTTVEHYSFGLCSLPLVWWQRPDVMVMAERPLANLFGVVLPKLGLGTRIVLRNGGSHRPPFRHVDVVIHHSPAFHDEATSALGETARHVHLPYAFDLRDPEGSGEAPAPLQLEHRKRLGLPGDRPIVISVGAIDRSVKRMDHIVREVASLPQPRPFVLLLGQQEREAAEVQAEARDLLGEGGYSVRSVEPHLVAEHLAAADLFVLASPKEGFGRVYVEALAAGLPCIVHDSDHTHWVLGDLGTFVDMLEPGALAGAIETSLADASERTPQRKAERTAEMYERYSWERLLPGYLEALGVGSKVVSSD
jgi:1,2-diacylglycerol 3-alpha-glucosyltransferase